MISLLYVDDEPALLDLCQRFLEQEGDISVVTMSSVGDALTRMTTERFDAIISDYQMPDHDGLAFLRRVRLQSPDIPFILFTGRGREEVVIEAINSGADSYVQKGGDPRAQFKELSHLVRQIVRRRKAENELRLMKFSVDHASEGIIWMKENGDISYYNDAICTMLGYTPREFSHLSVRDIRHGFSATSFAAGWTRVSARKCATIEDILRKKDGTFLPVELVLNYNEQGAESLIFAFVRDISDRRRSEMELKEAFRQLMVTEDGVRQQFEEIKKSNYAIRDIQQRYQMLLEETENWIWESNPDGRFTSSSVQVQDILGYRPREMTGKTFEEFLVPEDAAGAASELATVLVKKEAFRSLLLRMVHRDGREVMLEITGTPVFSRDGTFSGYYGFARDVTGENPHASAHPALVPGYRSFLDQAGDAIFVVDMQTGMLLDANQKALLLVNRTLPEVQAMRETALHPVGEEGHNADLYREHNRADSAAFEDMIVDRDGNRLPVIVSTKLLLVGDRQFQIGIYHDISDLRAIQDTLRVKSSELDRFFTTGPDLLCIIDAEGRFLRLNPAGESLLGCRAHEREVLSLFEIVHPDDCAATRTIIQHMGRRGKAVTFVNRVRRPDGSSRWLEWRAFMSGRSRIYAVARDMTEQRKVEQALAAANRKLNLLTDLNRHDIRNKLTVLTGYLDLFRNYPAEPYFSMYTEKINEMVAAIAAQVEFTRVYQNLGISSPGWFNVDRLFCRVCKTLNVTPVAVYSDPDGWEIFTDPLVERVFYTLVDNALRYGTTLTEIRRSAYETPGGLVIVIEDNGVGIAQEYKERIFEKENGKSVGHSRSLFLAREILSITGMTIRETGRAGKGARFEMLVPKGTYRVVAPDLEEHSGPVSAPHFITPPHHNHTS
ncbi:MAG: PAS domain S-box protein [Methanoregula sp.]